GVDVELASSADAVESRRPRLVCGILRNPLATATRRLQSGAVARRTNVATALRHGPAQVTVCSLPFEIASERILFDLAPQAIVIARNGLGNGQPAVCGRPLDMRPPNIAHDRPSRSQQ